MGNLLAIVSTRILQISTVIFTSLAYVPVVPVVSEEAALSSKCLFVGFDACSGSYHVVHRKPTQQVTSSILQESITLSDGGKADVKNTTCSCGRGAAKKDPERKFCKQIVGGLPSRCQCYNQMNACGVRCHCVQCDNPYGTSTKAKNTYTLTRVRQPSRLKAQKTESDAKLLLNRNITPLLGWSHVESMMFDCLVDHMSAQDVDLNAQNCLEEYEKLRIEAKQQGIHCLSPKSVSQVQGKVVHVRNCATVFEALYKKQIEANWFS